MFYFCGEQFIAFKVSKCNDAQDIIENSILFIFKDNKKLLLTVDDVDDLIDAAEENCRRCSSVITSYKIINLLGCEEESVEISKLIIMYKGNIINVLALEDMREFFRYSIHFELSLLDYTLYDWDTNTTIVFQDESINIMACDDRVVSYLNKFYFDLAKMKIYDVVLNNSVGMQRLEIGG